MLRCYLSSKCQAAGTRGSEKRRRSEAKEDVKMGHARGKESCKYWL